jgi:uncharacterized protein YoaH (UPF0181 family)
VTQDELLEQIHQLYTQLAQALKKGKAVKGIEKQIRELSDTLKKMEGHNGTT